MAGEWELAVNEIVGFYARKILGDSYALTYMDNHFSSLFFIAAFIVVFWGLIVFIPLHLSSWFLYFCSHRFKFLQSNNTTSDDDEFIESGTRGKKVREQMEKQSKFRRACNILTGASAVFWCIWVMIALIVLSTFSRMHYVWSGLLITIIWTVWFFNSFIIDVKWSLMMVVMRLTGQESFTNSHNTFLELGEEANSEDNESFLREGSVDATSRTSKREQAIQHAMTFGLIFKQAMRPMAAKKPIVTAIVSAVVVTLIFVCSILCTYFLFDICIAYEPIEISTHFTRTMVSDKTCQTNSVCFTYLTVPEKMSSEMIVNFQVSSKELYKGFAQYVKFDPYSKLEDEIDFEEYKQASCFKMENIYDEDRYQCFVELTDLDPESSYAIRTGYDATDNEEDFVVAKQIFKFRTTPDGNTRKTISFINGGDLAWGSAAQQIANVISTLGFGFEDIAPYFAIVGGDVSYDNGCEYCYQRWDSWFKNWETYMKTVIQYKNETAGDHKHTYTLPILTTVGNHEAGNFKRPISDDAFYLRYFPMQITGSTDRLVSDPQNSRNVKHVHYLSKHTVIVALDSWVHETPESQVQYVTDLFENKLKDSEKYKNKIIVIHHPMYSSISENDITKSMVAAWESIFLKYGVTAVFENHCHTYKQTYPIANGKVVTSQNNRDLPSFIYHKNLNDKSQQQGIMYFGDGSWGATFRGQQLDTKNPIFRQIQAISHVYHVISKIVPDGSSMIELSALGYNTTSKSVHEIEHSRVRILTQ